MWACGWPADWPVVLRQVQLIKVSPDLVSLNPINDTFIYDNNDNADDSNSNDTLGTILCASLCDTPSHDLDLAFDTVDSNVDLACTCLLSPPTSLPPHLPSAPSSAAAREPFWDPRVFTIIIIFFLICGCLVINLSLYLRVMCYRRHSHAISGGFAMYCNTLVQWDCSIIGVMWLKS